MTLKARPAPKKLSGEATAAPSKAARTKVSGAKPALAKRAKASAPATAKPATSSASAKAVKAKLGESPPRPFATASALYEWLRDNHTSESELWVLLYKKGTGIPSVTWEDCVTSALCWGWIDGLKRSFDDKAFLQRLTPRRPRSTWSTKNREIVQRLIDEGKMQPAGLAHVEAAKADGRWDAAYEGQSKMQLPEDFLAAVAANSAANALFVTLDKANLFAIYHRLQTAKRPETRAARLEAIVAKLARGEVFHARAKS